MDRRLERHTARQGSERCCTTPAGERYPERTTVLHQKHFHLPIEFLKNPTSGIQRQRSGVHRRLHCIMTTLLRKHSGSLMAYAVLLALAGIAVLALVFGK